MSDKKDKDAEVECGGVWKKVIVPDTYDSKGKQDHTLEQSETYTDNEGVLPEDNLPILDDHA